MLLNVIISCRRAESYETAKSNQFWLLFESESLE